MKIYTKTGDKGQTSLLGGARVPKYHLKIEAYGTLDELNSHIGLVGDLSSLPEITAFLRQIQDRIFVMGSILALETGKTNIKLPELLQDDVEDLERAIDALEQELPPMKHFVLPGGHPLVSHCHIARCVCRRSERLVVGLQEQEPVPSLILHYLNRLSDYLFVLARYFTQVLHVTEIPWIPNPR
jgi:cob(I)alamin adenosyltransferase